MSTTGRRGRYTLGMVAVAALGVACAPPDAEEPAAVVDSAPPAYEPILQPFDLGGDFVLTGTDGEPVDLADFRGRIVLLFFGYTSCPDFCPTTLSRLAQALATIEGDRDRVVTLFVSVDIERDTPEQLAEYLGYFDVGAIGLTGTREEIDAVVERYKGRYAIEASDSASGPLVAHTTYTYLIGAGGTVRYMFQHADTPAWIAAGIDAALREADAKPAATELPAAEPPG